MKTTFKQFMSKQCVTDEQAMDFIHHIAEEELISCKVMSVNVESNTDGVSTVKIVADCNDNKRPKGLQKDLSDKVTKRLTLHKIAGLGKIVAKVYHLNVDPR